MTMLTVALLSFGVASAQTRLISGKVTDSQGKPVPAATIKELKGESSVAADMDGNFKIKAKNGEVLVISSVNFEIERITVSASKDNYLISLKSRVSMMDEIVVTAGGIKSKRKEIGTANTVIQSQILTAGKATNIASGLQGKVAGFQISGTGGGVNPSYRLVLRGQRSLTGNNQALIVLDNVIVPSAVLGNLNPEDVENVVILNGSGAAALYGSQASNGAVIVTTKKGKRGLTTVNVSNTTTVESVAFYPKIQKNFGAGGTAYGIDANGNPYYNYLENQSYGAAFDGVKRELGPALEDGSQDSSKYQYNDGHLKFWEKGITNQTDFSVSNGDENSTFYFSGQYATVTGTTPGDKYNRATLRLNGTRKVGNKVNISYSSAYTQNRYNITTQTGSMYTNMLNMPSNVDITKYKNWRTDKFANPIGYYNPWYQNPYFTADNYRSNQRNDYLTANVELKFTPIAGLDLIARQGIASRNYSNKNTVGAFKFTEFAKNTDASSKSDISASVSDGSSYTTNLLTDLYAQFNKKVKDLSFTLIAGTQLNQNQSKFVNVAADGLVIPDLYNVSNGVGTPIATEDNFQARQVGAYGDLRIGYKNFLFLHGTGRNDWVSILSAQNRSFFYPSADLSFIASDAFETIRSSKTISYLKFRAGISKVGQVNLGNSNNFGAYSLLPTFSSDFRGFPYGGLAGYTVGNTLVSNNLKPELTRGYEFGFDLNMLNDRFVSSVTWYNTKTDDQTVTTSISNTTGFFGLLTNTGQTQSRGLELTAHFTPFKTANWNVTVGGNYTYLDNNVNFISADLPKLSLSTNGTGASYAVAGQAYPVIMGFDYVRDNAGHVIVSSVTGLPTKQSAISVLGNANAKNRVSIDGSVQYRNLRFSILFEYRGGYKIYNSMGPEMDWSGTGYRTAVYNRQSFIYPNSVIEDPGKPGTYIANTSIAIANGNGNNGFWTDGINRDVTSNYVTSGDFWKLREVSLAYDIPTHIFGKSNVIKGLTISLQGRNLFLWMAKDNLYTDPEYSSAGNDNNGIGITGLNSAPPSRFYGASVSFKF